MIVKIAVYQKDECKDALEEQRIEDKQTIYALGMLGHRPIRIEGDPTAMRLYYIYAKLDIEASLNRILTQDPSLAVPLSNYWIVDTSWALNIAMLRTQR